MRTGRGSGLVLALALAAGALPAQDEPAQSGDAAAQAGSTAEPSGDGAEQSDAAAEPSRDGAAEPSGSAEAGPSGAAPRVPQDADADGDARDAAAVDEAADAPRGSDDDEGFVPTEELDADEEVTFPVDI